MKNRITTKMTKSYARAHPFGEDNQKPRKINENEELGKRMKTRTIKINSKTDDVENHRMKT